MPDKKPKKKGRVVQPGKVWSPATVLNPNAGKDKKKSTTKKSNKKK